MTAPRSEGWRPPPLYPDKMAAACRKLASDLRREYAMGHVRGISLTAESGRRDNIVSPLQAAMSLDEQARRWDAEVRTGERNEVDRRKLGM